MSRSYIAKYIDEDYKKEQIFKKKKRQPCKTQKCTECKFFDICTERSDLFLNDMVEGFVEDMRNKNKGDNISEEETS